MVNLANRITLSRVFLIVPIIWLLHLEGRVACFAAALLFVLASLTDFLDGHIARREKMVTSFGKFLDPLADKLLVCSVLIMFAALSRVPAWIVILIICRELAVTGLRAMAMDAGVVIAADSYGKAKTVLQILAIVPLLAHYPVFGFDVQAIGIFFLYIALVLTLFSGVNYFVAFYRTWVQKAGVPL